MDLQWKKSCHSSTLILQTKLVSFGLCLDAPPPPRQTQDALRTTTYRYKHLQHM